MPSAAGFTIRVEYIPEYNAYLAYPCCHIATEADCVAWAGAYFEAFKGIPRPIDCVLILDMFTIDAAIVDTWGRYRARLYDELMRYAVRVDSNSSVILSGHLSRRKLTRSEVADSIPAALALIEDMRARKL